MKSFDYWWWGKNQLFDFPIKEFSKANFIIPESDIIDFKEALIFAFLGVLRLKMK